MIVGAGTKRVRAEYVDSESDGCGILLWQSCLLPGRSRPVLIAGSRLGEKGLPAESVGEQARQKLQRELDAGAAVDRHMADNLIPFIAMHGGRIRTSEITRHIMTNTKTTELFLGGRFTIEGAMIGYLPDVSEPVA
jgi:RNA 3'-terminal phosphate cyclase